MQKCTTEKRALSVGWSLDFDDSLVLNNSINP